MNLVLWQDKEFCVTGGGTYSNHYNGDDLKASLSVACNIYHIFIPSKAKVRLLIFGLLIPLGAFAKSPEATISFLISVRTHGTTLHEIWFSKIFRESVEKNSGFIKIRQE
jgi:hypothetical protein